MAKNGEVSGRLSAKTLDGSDTPAISVEDLTKVYDVSEGKIRAVDEVSFIVESGSVVGVLGPNGAGKTTLIKSILGLILPTAGDVRINNVDVHTHPSRAYRHAGAMLEGARNIYWRLTVRENLEFFATLAGQSPESVRDRHDELLETFDFFTFGLIGLIAADVEAVSALKALPLSQSSHLLSRAMEDQVRLWEMAPADLGIVLVVTIIYPLLGVAFFKLAQRRARKLGVMGHY